MAVRRSWVMTSSPLYHAGGLTAMNANVTLSACIVSNNEALLAYFSLAHNPPVVTTPPPHATCAGILLRNSIVLVEGCTIEDNVAVGTAAPGGIVTCSYNQVG